MQRFFDFVFSSLALIIISPLLIIVIFALKITGEGEIFFVQSRIGVQGNKFNLLKFATMLKDSPNMSLGTVTTKNDPRILPFGKFLRSSKINELPQLINVIKGDMSLIGPRPLTKEAFMLYDNDVQKILNMVKPGLSGIGSIVFRDEENILNSSNAVEFFKTVIMPYKGKLETWFVKNNNISLYFLSILITIYIVFFPKSKIVWYLFKDIPKPPSQLEGIIN